MATHKLVTIIGIHARETFLNASDSEALSQWKTAKANPNFVAGALFKGGHKAPLSGQEFWLVHSASKRAKNREL